MAIPVVQLGTGNVGIHALRALITNPEFELTGARVSSQAKAGKDQRVGVRLGNRRSSWHDRVEREVIDAYAKKIICPAIKKSNRMNSRH